VVRGLAEVATTNHNSLENLEKQHQEMRELLRNGKHKRVIGFQPDEEEKKG